MHEFLSEVYWMSKEGCKAALIEAGIITPYLSQADAYRTYGRAMVEKWCKQGIVRPTKTGPNTSKVLYQREELFRASVKDYRGADIYRTSTYESWRNFLSSEGIKAAQNRK